jgi:3-hydroxyacyl-[acyl-carrier-protein] dehydratase
MLLPAVRFLRYTKLSQMAIYDSKALQQILPHRYPFLMVDAIIEMEPRKRIVGIKQVSIGEPFFQGHFPGMPVMPGVLQIEALAQVGAVLALRELEDADAKIPLFSGIDGARFRRPVVPGDTLRLEVTAIRPGRRIQKMRGVATVNGEVTTETEILCIIADRTELNS